MRIGSLCSGMGGLELGVQAVYGGTTAWVSDIDKGACKILAHRFPGVPNIGDMTTVDWAAAEPVDLICGGTPCQDLSHAGKRAGMTEGTRSNLWVAMREAIAVIRPKYVVWENVRGAASAEADSDLVNDPRLLAGVRRRDGQPLLRALGRVVGDLSDLGYDCRWHGLRAADDVGAPHGRFRFFIAATNSASKRRAGPQQPFQVVERNRPEPAHAGAPRGALLPTPTVQDGANTGGPSQYDRNSLPLNALVTLLPTPAVNDMGAGKTVEAWDEWTDAMQARHGNGNGHGKSLAIEAQRLAWVCDYCGEPRTPDGCDNCDAGPIANRLLPTPTATEGRKGDMGETAEQRSAAGHHIYIANALASDQWGDYAAAIARWEHVLGRPAPAPTMTSTKGNPQLSPAFVEWLMGLPAGWVTDVPGITRNEALKALGNGVVWQQCAAALREMASWDVAA